MDGHGYMNGISHRIKSVVSENQPYSSVPKFKVDLMNYCYIMTRELEKRGVKEDIF